MDSVDSSPDWVEYIQNRIERARQWRMEMATHRELAKDYLYIRIRGKTFRAVSISNENPCGRLIRRDNGKEILGRKYLASAIQSARDASNTYNPGNQKPEHKVQAFLIRHALMNRQEMQGVIKGFDDVFEKLIFITDELSAGKSSAGKLRADIIALGSKNGRYFPVFIELKNKRELKRLEQQLEGAKLVMSENAAKMAFIGLLSATSGIPADKIKFEDHKLMAVWPSASGGKEAPQVEKAREKGYLFAEFSDPVNQEYSIRRY